MKKLTTFVLSTTLLLSLGACSSNETAIEKTSADEVEPKTSENAESEETVVEETDASTEETEVPVEEATDIWTYHENATEQLEWEGLKFDIEKVVTSDEAPGYDDEYNEIITSAVGFQIKVENTTTDKIYTTYPDQATLVTSTGEQVEADMMVSEDLGGDIHEGVIKQGDVIFYLDRGAASEIEWVKLNWSSNYSDPEGDYDNDLYQDHSVKIELK